MDASGPARRPSYTDQPLHIATHQLSDENLMAQYTMSDGRVDSMLHHPPLTPGALHNPALASSFSNYPNVAIHTGMNQSFDFDPDQMQIQTLDSAGAYPRGGSISGTSDDFNRALGHNPLSVGSPDDSKPSEGQPESLDGMGMFGMGSMMGVEGTNVAGSSHSEDYGDQGEGPWGAKRDSKDEAPAWSELKTKAGKERKRLPLACIACRRKKIRCSGEKPACKHCLRSRIPCVYKVTTRKAAPRTDYMAMLDKRLKRMEDRVLKMVPKEDAVVISIQRAVVKPALPVGPPQSKNAKKRSADDIQDADLETWAKSKNSDQQSAAAALAAGQNSDDGGLLTEGVDSLPSQDIQEHLAEVYFDYVYGQSYPLLHKPSFMSKLAAGQVPPVLVLAVCAVSARFSTHAKLRTEPAFLRGEQWASKAREISLKRYDSPNITILTVYLLLGLHEFGTCHGGRSWMIGGMAQRMAYALQLHNDLAFDPSAQPTESKPELSFTDREIRRRTMWSCFLMDRFNSSGTERPLFVNEQFIKAQLPVKERNFILELECVTENLDPENKEMTAGTDSDSPSPRENMGVCAYLIRLVKIWGMLINYINLGGIERDRHTMWEPESTYHQLKNRITEFKRDLPDSLQYNAENLQSHAANKTANQFLYLHVVYYQIILFLNRFSLPSTAGVRPPKQMPHEFLTEAAHCALDSANKISQLLSEAIDYRLVAPFAGYSAFFSSTVHVHGVFSKNTKQQALSKKHLASNIKYLTQMKKYWGMFHFVTENLKELYRQHSDAAAHGSAEGVKSFKAGIFQYGDWFNRYPHGVSKTDFEGPPDNIKREPGTDAALSQKSDLQSVEEFFASLSPPSRAEHQRKIGIKKARHARPPSVDVPPDRRPVQAHQQTQQPTSHPQPGSNVAYQQSRGQGLSLHEANQGARLVEGVYYNTAMPTPYQNADYAALAHGHIPLHIATMGFPPNSPSYPGMPPSAGGLASPATPSPLVGNMAAMNAFWGMGMHGLPNSIVQDPSGTFFMPFNMEPPASTGDDAAMFGGTAWDGSFDMLGGMNNINPGLDGQGQRMDQ